MYRQMGSGRLKNSFFLIIEKLIIIFKYNLKYNLSDVSVIDIIPGFEMKSITLFKMHTFHFRTGYDEIHQ